MDDTRGNFIPITEEEFKEQIKQPEPLVFRVGEILIIRGSRLRVLKILKNKIILKLLPKN